MSRCSFIPLYVFFPPPNSCFRLNVCNSNFSKKKIREFVEWENDDAQQGLSTEKKMWIKSCAFVTRTKKCETGTLLLQCCCRFGCCCWCHLHITQQQRPLLSVPACVCVVHLCAFESCQYRRNFHNRMCQDFKTLILLENDKNCFHSFFISDYDQYSWGTW